MLGFCQIGLITPLFIPTIDNKERAVVYTLAVPGAHELARLTGISHLGLASSRKPSFLFLEHGLRVSDFMCCLEAALKDNKANLLSWKSERQLKSAGGKPLKVPNPLELGEKIPVIPDGFFSIEIDSRKEHFFLEADRGTMALYTMKKKMLGYIQLYRKQLHKQTFGIPHFRVLLITNTAYRLNKLREIMHRLGYCPNMFWFTRWEDITPQRILEPIWLRCQDQKSHSLLK